MRFFLLALICCFITNCATPEPNYKVVGDIDSLAGAQNLHVVTLSSNNDKNNLTVMHSEAIQEIALSIGAQAGLAAGSKKINSALQQNASSLDRIFNFNLMLLPHNVIPPILTESDNSFNLDDPQTIRISDKNYQIVSQAHFVTVTPVWQNYLWMNYEKPKLPPASFLPKTIVEQIVWQKYITIGWQKGLDQASQIYAVNLALIKRDFLGMALYKKLLANKMVSQPFVASTDLGVTGDGSNLRIHDKILRITALPTLQTNANRWKPVVMQDDTPP